MRTILVHLNVEVPDSATEAQVVDQIQGALSVGINEDETPALTQAGTNVVLAEFV